MRRWSLGFVVILVLAAGCSGASTPRQAAEGYLGALSKLDFEEASRYVADEGRANFEVLRKLYSGLGPEEQKKFQVNDWLVTTETITGDAATVDFTFDQVKKGQLSLRKGPSGWKVDQRKTF